MNDITDRHEMVRLANKDYRRLCRMALDVQNASNLSGVLNSAFEAACSLKKCQEHSSTLEINHHFVMRLFASKIADLSGINHTWPADAEQDAIDVCSRFDTEGNRVARL